MSSEQQRQRPVTYGDIFSSVKGALATQAITAEDAALMQSAETLALGQSQKGGAAAILQAAADENVRSGAVPRNARSCLADEGVSVVQESLPGGIVHTEFVAGQPISTAAVPTPMLPELAALQDTITIGEALEAVAVSAGEQPIDCSDASAIQSAEKRATGLPLTLPGGLSATAQAAAELNPRVQDFSKTTLSDVLMDASSMLPCDKTVTREDAEKVAKAELRNKQTGEFREGGVAAGLIAAAELNEGMAIAPSPQMQQVKMEDAK